MGRQKSERAELAMAKYAGGAAAKRTDSSGG